ncbi:hypothetical protein PHMEG_00028970 [Phytophthora megakarya]|uniref:Uncharacterized protein n=1 Tax=Phytophthora megakarya TaxID=4795 RepID=A0A225V4D1_9STRA|nr:hypothetical protein PHMEG_00028970 [Phytophthora megakarya]
MFSSWDLVRPRFWYPMSSMEQSMMELEHMSDLMSRSHFPFNTSSGMLAVPNTLDDDDFFRDLPMLTREQRPAASHDNDPNKEAADTISHKNTNRDAKQNETGNKRSDTDQQKGRETQGADNQFRRGFSSYSFSNSSILDDKGQRVTSTRRRYEDSTGRLKAVHEREVDGKKLRSTWNRMGPDDEGHHAAVCSSGTPDEFEAMWKHTPFGEAHKKTINDQQQMQLEHKQQATGSKSGGTPMEE